MKAFLVGLHLFFGRGRFEVFHSIGEQFEFFAVAGGPFFAFGKGFDRFKHFGPVADSATQVVMGEGGQEIIEVEFADPGGISGFEFGDDGRELIPNSVFVRVGLKAAGGRKIVVGMGGEVIKGFSILAGFDESGVGDEAELLALGWDGDGDPGEG